jgi:hypothetical protein
MRLLLFILISIIGLTGCSKGECYCTTELYFFDYSKGTVEGVPSIKKEKAEESECPYYKKTDLNAVSQYVATVQEVTCEFE